MRAARPQGACARRPLPEHPSEAFARRTEGAVVLLLDDVLDYTERVLVGAYPHLALDTAGGSDFREPPEVYVVEDLVFLVLALRDTIGRYYDAWQSRERAEDRAWPARSPR